MSKDLISKKTRYEFREYFVRLTLREIDMEFDAADVPVDEDYDPQLPGQRRSRVAQYYHTVDWTNWRHVRRILAVFGNVLAQLENEAGDSTFGTINEPAKNVFQSLRKWIERDGFIYRDGMLIPRGDVAQLPSVGDAAITFDAPELHRQLERMRAAVDDDPALAIGTAKELIETTCKTILGDREVSFEAADDLLKLVKTTRQALGLMPNDIPNSKKGADVIRRLLSSLGTVAQSLGELRNLYGTGHGREGRTKGLTARHAKLAVGAAATLTMFLFETHQDREM